MSDADHLQAAIDLAVASAGGDGGPFGAVVVRDGTVVATGVNRVTATHDPTAHAEVVALRSAGVALATNDLGGCVLYASTEPCPMCLAAAWWARVDRIAFAATRHDAATAGFDDAAVYDEVARPLAERVLPTARVALPTATDPFAAWAANAARTAY